MKVRLRNLLKSRIKRTELKVVYPKFKNLGQYSNLNLFVT